MKTLLLVLLILAASVFGQSQQPMTIDQAIKQAIDHNPLIEQASQAVNSASARVEQSRSGYYPTSDVDVAYTHLSPVSQMAFPGMGEFQLFPANNYDGHISVKETIYDFGKTSASMDVSQSGIATASTNIDIIKTNIAYQTIQAFYAILFLEKSIGVQDEQMEALSRHQEDTRKKILAGTATVFDTLTTRVRITSIQNKKFDLQNDLQKREATLRRLLGLQPGSEIHLQGEFNTIPVAVSSDSLIASANQRRLELKEAHQEVAMAELKEKLVSLNDMPSLKVNAQYGLKNGLFPDMDVLRGNWVLGLDAKIPVFNGYLTRNQEEEMKAAKLGTEARTRDLERMIMNEVLQAISDVQTNEKKIATSTSQIEQATEALNLANLRYKDGVATNLDVIDAETNLSQAELSRLDAMYNYVLSRYALDKAVGEELF
jgi:outer membrane protein TolC